MTGSPESVRATGSTALTADTLEPRVGEEFVFERPAAADGSSTGEVRMKLVDLRRYPRHALSAREPFSMVFVLKNQVPLGRGLVRLVHPVLEPFDMFLSRVTVPLLQREDPAAIFYEAVFN